MKIEGIAASEGISIAKVFKLTTPEFTISEEKISDKKLELEKLEKAINLSEKEINKIRQITAQNVDEEHAMIFDAHIQILKDPEIERQVKEMINNDSVNAAFAFKNVSETFAMIFETMDNAYMKERAADVRDVSKRVISNLLGIKVSDPSLIDTEVIIVADDLTPSDTAQFNKKFVKGFATNIGGRTSHSVIMARSLEIPAVVGTVNVLDKVNNNDLIILDGTNGDIIVNPTPDEIGHYQKLDKEYQERKAIWVKLKDKESITLDNHKVELVANIGSPDDISGVINNGAEGVGLYRTEFLYMNNDDFPTEDEQYIAYKMVLEKLPNKPVVIRTLDIGGDKELSYMDMPKELNPFLGYRALRLCLDRKDLFKTQLRALLRASVHGKLNIMFPMIATLNELRTAKAILKECHQELIDEGHEVSNSYKVGMMVEVPAAALLADQFAKEVDFFSIGTNDLIQYSFAADRMNERVSYLYQPYNPSLLRLIKMVIDASHKEGIWTGVCGEIAGDKIAAIILLGLGLDEFSMSATSILQIRDLFSKIKYSEMKDIAEQALKLQTNEEVKKLVDEKVKEILK